MTARLLTLLLLAPSLTLADPPAGRSEATLPTPAQLAEQWQASQSKYDGERQQWLARVASGDSAGPFRPDWASLTHYHTPPWYEEARFGISNHWGEAADGLHLTLPAKPLGHYAWVFRIDTE